MWFLRYCGCFLQVNMLNCSGWLLGCCYVVSNVLWVTMLKCSGWLLGCRYVVSKVLWVVFVGY